VAAGTSNGQTIRVSVRSDGSEVTIESTSPAISSDGRFVTFSTAASLLAADGNGQYDIYVYDRSNQTLALASVDSSGAIGNGHSFQPAISNDGHAVAFASEAKNLVAGDTNGITDVFVHDFAAGTTVCASLSSGGTFGNARSSRPSIDTDGLVVAFESDANDLVSGDRNFVTDVFVRDLASGVTTRASVGDVGQEGNWISRSASISGDGTRIAFESFATNLLAGGDANGQITDVFLRDTAASTTTLVSIDDQGLQAMAQSWDPSISLDGTRVVFTATDGYFDTQVNFGSDIVLRDLVAATSTLVSATAVGYDGDRLSQSARISGDGSVVAFMSYATDLVPDDANDVADVFVRDFRGGYLQRVSIDDRGAEGDKDADYVHPLSIDGSGIAIAFSSWATNLVANDHNGALDVFVRARSPTLASSAGYGTGWTGTLGIPALTAVTPPALSTDVQLHVENSYTWWTLGFALFGADSASIPTSLGGDLLVDIAAVVPLAIGPGGADFGGHLPDDAGLYGVSGYAQVLELDPGASRGVSFTAGLELFLGR
jgi:Tol biopolymer transport system component